MQSIIANAFLMLQSNPPKFLTHYSLRIGGLGTQGASGVTQYGIIDQAKTTTRPGSIMGKHNLHAAESYFLKPVESIIDLSQAHLFSTHAVHMIKGFNPANFYQLDATGPNLVVTGQLSGCAIVIEQLAGNAINIAHVQPLGGTTGVQLQDDIKTNHPQYFCYGASKQRGFYDADDRAVCVFGKRNSSGVWHIYAQKQDRTPTGNYAIKSVYQIYPNFKKIF